MIQRSTPSSSRSRSRSRSSAAAAHEEMNAINNNNKNGITVSSTQDASFHQSEKEISNTMSSSAANAYKAKIIFVDLIFWIVTFWRDYSGQSGRGQMTISHYVWTQPPVDIAILLFCPTHFLHWFEVFRALECVQCLALVIQLWWFGLDGPSMLMTQLRVAVCIFRLLDSLHGIWQKISKTDQNNIFDFINHRLFLAPRNTTPPTISNNNSETVPVNEFVPLQYELGQLFTHLRKIPSPSKTDFLTSIFFIMFANFASSTHNPFDEPGKPSIIGPLTQYQAGDAFTIFPKLFVFDRLIGNYRKRALMYFLFFFSLAFQWFVPGMLPMYSEAAYPYLHAGAELSLLWSSIQRFMLCC